MAEIFTSKTIYYFSDRDSDHIDQRITLLNEYFQESREETMLDVSVEWWSSLWFGDDLTGPFVDQFTDWVSDNPYTDYGVPSNSIILFELTNGLRDLDVIDIVNLTSSMWSFFRTAKETVNAKVMFICDTDESLYDFAGYILDYVDVHVNTDLITPFIDSFFRKMIDDYVVETDEGYCQYPVKNAIIFLDKTFSQDYYLYEYFIPYFESWYGINFVEDEYSYNNIIEIRDFFAELFANEGIRLVGTLEDGTYCDFSTYSIYTQQQLSNNTGFYQYTDGEDNLCFYKVYALCSTESIDFVQWINQIRTIRSSISNLFSIFALIPNEEIWRDFERSYFDSETEEFPIIYDDIYTFGRKMWTFEEDLCQILPDMMLEADLTPYDTWVGRCAVTYKPIIVGDGGWIRIPCRIIEEWQYILPTTY